MIDALYQNEAAETYVERAPETPARLAVGACL